MTTDLADEFRRKVRMFGHCWVLVLHGRMFGLRALGPLYWVEMVSHRLLRYASGLLHLALLATSLVLAFGRGGVYAVVLGAAGAVRCSACSARSRCAGACACSRCAALLPARDARDAARARRRRDARRARRLGAGGGHAVSATSSASSARSTSSAQRVGLALGAPSWRLAALARSSSRTAARSSSARSALGRGGSTFEVLKLRTMIVDAERHGQRRYAVDARRLRASRASGGCCGGTSIDELPQLWNVLRGDMSLVGPRPTLAYQVERYDERQRRRLEVRPGLTGLGAGQRPRVAARGPSGSSSTSGTSSTARSRSTCASCCARPRVLAAPRRRLSQRDRRLARAVSDERPELTVVIPAFNEADTILARDRARARAPVRAADHRGRRLLARRHGRARRGSRRASSSAATSGTRARAPPCAPGFALARGRIVVVQDADLEYDPADIPALDRSRSSRATPTSCTARA